MADEVENVVVVEPEGQLALPEASHEPSLALPEATPVPAPTPAPTLDWRERRIAQQTAKVHERDQKIRELESQLAGLSGVTTAPVPPDDFEARVSAEAARRASETEFNRACNEAAAAGRVQFPDFDQTSRELVRVVDVNSPVQVAKYNEFLSVALETGNAPQILYSLGKDLNEAARVMALSPAKMAVELVKLASAGAAPPSGLPKPITPVAQRGVSHEAVDPRDVARSDHLSTREWMRRREEQVAKQARG